MLVWFFKWRDIILNEIGDGGKLIDLINMIVVMVCVLLFILIDVIEFIKEVWMRM